MKIPLHITFIICRCFSLFPPHSVCLNVYRFRYLGTYKNGKKTNKAIKQCLVMDKGLQTLEALTYASREESWSIFRDRYERDASIETITGSMVFNAHPGKPNGNGFEPLMGESNALPFLLTIQGRHRPWRSGDRPWVYALTVSKLRSVWICWECRICPSGKE